MRVRSAVLVLSVLALPGQLFGQKAAAVAATTWGPWAAVNMTTFGGDDVSGQHWDSRQWDKQSSAREKLFWLAVEACLEL